MVTSDYVKIAIENGPVKIVDLPSKNKMMFQFAILISCHQIAIIKPVWRHSKKGGNLVHPNAINYPPTTTINACELFNSTSLGLRTPCRAVPAATTSPCAFFFMIPGGKCHVILWDCMGIQGNPWDSMGFQWDSTKKNNGFMLRSFHHLWKITVFFQVRKVMVNQRTSW